MHHHCMNLRQSFKCDALPLFDGKWMVGRLQFDARADAVVAQVHLGLEVERIRVARKARIEPAEEGADVRASGLVEILDPLQEARFAQGDPDAPGKGFSAAVDRDVEAAAYKELFLIDDAVVRA